MTACRDAATISVLWASGIRRSELARLAASDLDLDGINLLVRQSKTGRPRRAPLDERSVRHLLRYLAKLSLYPVQDVGDALWVGKNGPLTADGIRLMLQRRCRDAGVNVSAHAFRRGWTVHSLGKRGISQASVMTAAGWAIGSPMAQRYTGASPSR
jgi:integrase